MVDKLIPEIRFEGFTEAWEQRKLEDVASYIRGSFPQPYTKPEWFDEENGKPFVQVADIGFDLALNEDTKLHISKLAESKSRFVEKGKVVVALQGSIEKSIGRVAITQYPAYFDRTILIFETYKIEIDNYYFAQVIQNLFKIEKERAWGATISTITKEAVNNFTIGVPSKSEQIKIGNFFKQLDKTIALQERKLNLLKEKKKGFLQKMFPKSNEKFPELRFEGFTEALEQRKLGEISNKVTEKNKNNKFLETLTNSAEYGIISQRDFFDKDISNEKNLNNYYIVREDDFVYNPRISNFAPVGPIKRNKLGREGVMSPLYYVFRTNSVNNTYLEYYFSATSWHRFMEINGDSGARADRFAIKDSVFKTMPIPYPIIEEQTKIGNFFKQLDETITLQEQQLKQMKEMKKGFLQKMFA